MSRSCGSVFLKRSRVEAAHKTSTAAPSDVTEALALMVGGSNCDEKNWLARKMDTDDSSDYGSVDNTEGEDDDLDEHVKELSDCDGD